MKLSTAMILTWGTALLLAAWLLTSCATIPAADCFMVCQPYPVRKLSAHGCECDRPAKCEEKREVQAVMR